MHSDLVVKSWCRMIWWLSLGAQTDVVVKSWCRVIWWLRLGAQRSGG